jgi:hypothetical protein
VSNCADRRQSPCIGLEQLPKKRPVGHSMPGLKIGQVIRWEQDQHVTDIAH